jgi:hypothetical protein
MAYSYYNVDRLLRRPYGPLLAVAIGWAYSVGKILEGVGRVLQDPRGQARRALGWVFEVIDFCRDMLTRPFSTTRGVAAFTVESLFEAPRNPYKFIFVVVTGTSMVAVLAAVGGPAMGFHADGIVQLMLDLMIATGWVYLLVRSVDFARLKSFDAIVREAGVIDGLVLLTQIEPFVSGLASSGRALAVEGELAMEFRAVRTAASAAERGVLGDIRAATAAERGLLAEARGVRLAVAGQRASAATGQFVNQLVFPNRLAPTSEELAGLETGASKKVRSAWGDFLRMLSPRRTRL